MLKEFSLKSEGYQSINTQILKLKTDQAKNYKHLITF